MDNTIRIAGSYYNIYKDSDGVERFKRNELVYKTKIEFSITASSMIKLFELEAISQLDLLDWYTGIGFTVSGVEELSFFADLEFERT